MKDQDDHEAWLREWAVKLHGESLSHVVTVASGALTVLVTFRHTLLEGAESRIWVLGWAWIALACSITSAVVGKAIAASVAGSIANESGREPKFRSWLGDALSLLAFLAFALGIIGLTIFGLSNLSTKGK